MKQCEFEGCSRAPRAKFRGGLALCTGHYAQALKGKPLTPLRKFRKVTDGQKECSKCEEVKPLSEYTMRPSGNPLSWCNDCNREFQREKYRRLAETGQEQSSKNSVGTESTTITKESE